MGGWATSVRVIPQNFRIHSAEKREIVRAASMRHFATQKLWKEHDEKVALREGRQHGKVGDIHEAYRQVWMVEILAENGLEELRPRLKRVVANEQVHGIAFEKRFEEGESVMLASAGSCCVVGIDSYGGQGHPFFSVA